MDMYIYIYIPYCLKLILIMYLPAEDYMADILSFFSSSYCKEYMATGSLLIYDFRAASQPMHAPECYSQLTVIRGAHANGQLFETITLFVCE